MFDRLTTLVSTVPVYRLGYSNLTDAVAQVTRLLAEPEGAEPPY